jgi:DNA-binding CsgD family transcriptional regulator
MAEISQIKHWRAPTTLGVAYENLLHAIDKDALGPTLLESIKKLTAGVQRLYLFESTSEEQNQLQYYFCEPHVEELFPTYNKWYLRQDPIAEAYRAAPMCSDVVLQRIRPDDISSSGFRQRFFEEAGIVERVAIVQKGQTSWRGMTMARHKSQGCFSDEELSNVLGLAFLALPMIPLCQRLREDADHPSVDLLEARFENRFTQLTHRERQVCARAVLGMSVEATARDLGIAKTSVLTYRQRAYLRLNVKSPLELSALVH